jgi:hypothetical protein
MTPAFDWIHQECGNLSTRCSTSEESRHSPRKSQNIWPIHQEKAGKQSGKNRPDMGCPNAAPNNENSLTASGALSAGVTKKMGSRGLSGSVLRSAPQGARMMLMNVAPACRKTRRFKGENKSTSRTRGHVCVWDLEKGFLRGVLL